MAADKDSFFFKEKQRRNILNVCGSCGISRMSLADMWLAVNLKDWFGSLNIAAELELQNKYI